MYTERILLTDYIECSSPMTSTGMEKGVLCAEHGFVSEVTKYMY